MFQSPAHRGLYTALPVTRNCASQLQLEAMKLEKEYMQYMLIKAALPNKKNRGTQ